MICPKCNKSGIYICSDKRNAWCRNCESYFAHFDGSFFYLGSDPSLQYAVREDGTIKKIKRKEEGYKVIIEEERLIELENELKKLIANKKAFWEKYVIAYNWFVSLDREKLVKAFELCTKDKQKEEDDRGETNQLV